MLTLCLLIALTLLLWAGAIAWIIAHYKLHGDDDFSGALFMAVVFSFISVFICIAAVRTAAIIDGFKLN